MCGWLQNLQKELIWGHIFFENILYEYKNAEFDADFESFEKITKKLTQKYSIGRKICHQAARLAAGLHLLRR
jgi:hypothetical protein